MIKLLLALLLIPSVVFAAAPTRTSNYTTQTTIRSADVSGNENAIFNYLQAGVDTYLDGSIIGADISSAAAIGYNKLNLTNGIINSDISSSAAIGYSKLNLGTSIVNSDISASAGIVGSKLDLTSPGAIGSTSAGTGAFSTLKVGTTHQGDILYDNGTSLVRLPPGTSGQALLTNGAAANPSWGSGGAVSFISNTTISTADNTGDIAITSTNYYTVKFKFNTLSADDFFLLRFNNSSSAVYNYIQDGRTTGGAITGGAASATSIAINTSQLSGGDRMCAGTINIYPQQNSNIIFIDGTITYQNTASSLSTYLNFSGQFSGASATSFRLLSSGGATFSGNVYLYKYNLS